MLCPKYVRCKEPLKKPLSLRKSIRTKLHPYFHIILVFGLSKMELSFITGCKGGCNAVYDGHVYKFDWKKDSGVMHWQCKGKRTVRRKTRLYSRCLGGVEACYSSLQFNHRNQELLRLYGIYMDLQPHISGRNVEPPRVC